jgi:monovalent cation:H+ antiporter-2, CPA2 family
VDIGVAMGPVIATIHEKRDQLRAQIKAEAEMEDEPRRLAKRRVRDTQASAAGSNLNTPAV